MEKIYLVTTQQRMFDDSIQVVSIAESLKLLAPLEEVGLDTETRGLDPYTKELLSIQLGCKDFQVVIDCTTIGVKFFKDYMQSDRLFIGWNIKFDMKFLFHKKVDPLLLHHIYFLF